MEAESTFEEFVREAWEHQHTEGALSTKDTEALQRYLVHVLLRFLESKNTEILSQPLLVEFFKRRHGSLAEIQEVGDAMLFRVGVIGLSMIRSSLVKIPAYVNAGANAYNILAVRTAAKHSDESAVYAALAYNLTPYVNVLIEVSSEHIVQPTYDHVLLVCERYCATKSSYDRAWLIRHGVALPKSTHGNFV